ncbi:MAG: tRNA epoxyqueuosine(34) reductase QueG [Bacteroidia bacterium]
MTGTDLIANLRSKRIKEIASDSGFSFTGISRATELTSEAKNLEIWLSGNMHGSMNYMERNFDKRIDPRVLVPGSKSVISMLLNYYPDKLSQETGAPKISKYAYGEDYHFVIKRKLKQILYRLKEEFGDFNARIFVDSAPVMDKVWAKKSGLGWIGKNSNLIHKKAGSFFFIAEIICDLELEPDVETRDYCGTCSKCIDACPTNAIVEPYLVDGSKCISYLTIELKESIEPFWKDKMDSWVFGCDICQDVCPWNRFSKPHTEPDFNPNLALLKMSAQEWEDMSEETFGRLFENSAVQRTGFNRLKENIHLIRSGS